MTAENDAAVWDEALDEVESLIRSGVSVNSALWAAREDNPYRVTPPEGGSTDAAL